MQAIYIVIGVVVGGVVAYLVTRRPKQDAGTETGFSLLMQQVADLQKVVDSKLSESERSMRESMQHQHSQSAQIISDITERLTRLDEGNKQVMGFAEGLAQLQDILKNPKQRGVLGEYYLETLLKNIMSPTQYEMQYKLGKDDEGRELIPDAVVFVKNKIIPIDSKFSLENYNRLVEETNPTEKERLEKLFVNDLKNRITETSKYIRPDKNTMEFAFMFIPHEAIYYDLLVNKVGALKDEESNLIQRAAAKYKVIIVSPTSFLAYLQTVLQGLNALKIEEQTKEIIKRVGELNTHLKSYQEFHTKLGNALATTVNQFNKSSAEFKKIDKDVTRITGESIGIESMLLDKPHTEDE